MDTLERSEIEHVATHRRVRAAHLASESATYPHRTHAARVAGELWRAPGSDRLVAVRPPFAARARPAR